MADSRPGPLSRSYNTGLHTVPDSIGASATSHLAQGGRMVVDKCAVTPSPSSHLHTTRQPLYTFEMHEVVWWTPEPGSTAGAVRYAREEGSA
jgi:hypothetical protein